jgi:hypothetical protein
MKLGFVIACHPRSHDARREFPAVIAKVTGCPAILHNRPMTVPLSHPTSRRGVLMLADISGYTSFLQGVADAHRDLIVEADEPPPAYALLSHLLDTISGSIVPLFRLAKFEGDAIFAVEDAPIPPGDAVLDCLRACYAAFQGSLAAAGSLWTCSCTACARIDHLDLKFVVHQGRYVAQSIAGHEELLGTEVNLVHRLLKNHARGLVGPVPYALITDSTVDALEVPTQGMVPGQEAYDDVPAVDVWVMRLGTQT